MYLIKRIQKKPTITDFKHVTVLAKKQHADSAVNFCFLFLFLETSCIVLVLDEKLAK